MILLAVDEFVIGWRNLGPSHITLNTFDTWAKGLPLLSNSVPNEPEVHMIAQQMQVLPTLTLNYQ